MGRTRKGVGAFLSFSLGREVGWGLALIRGWALIKFFCLQDGHLFEVGANSRCLFKNGCFGSLLGTGFSQRNYSHDSKIA